MFNFLLTNGVPHLNWVLFCVFFCVLVEKESAPSILKISDWVFSVYVGIEVVEICWKTRKFAQNLPKMKKNRFTKRCHFLTVN